MIEAKYIISGSRIAGIEMELYFIRHGIAQQLGKKNNFTDELRALTVEGRTRLRQIALGLQTLGVDFDLLLTSPLDRAVETANILARALKLSEKALIQSEALRPGGSCDALFAQIKDERAVESVGLVGHQPDLGKAISQVVQGNSNLSIELRKGGVCCLRVNETVPEFRGTLEWLATPRQLRALAKF